MSNFSFSGSLYFWAHCVECGKLWRIVPMDPTNDPGCPDSYYLSTLPRCPEHPTAERRVSFAVYGHAAVGPKTWEFTSSSSND